jgi:succinate-semialdehyde dehydrogenase/glutarate-semialdehyde dehydrogenase
VVGTTLQPTLENNGAMRSSPSQDEGRSGSPGDIGNGKRIAESRREVELSASIMQYFADNAEVFLAPRIFKSVTGDARLEYSPFGVLLSIQSWNYPYYQLARFAGPHLMSGDVMLLKRAPGVPQQLQSPTILRLNSGVPCTLPISKGASGRQPY